MKSIKPKDTQENTAVESWLYDQVAPAFDRLKDDYNITEEPNMGKMYQNAAGSKVRARS